MKLNKKIVVASLSTMLGLGVVGGLTGTVAWYQYSTRASASIIATNTGNTGLLQIKSGSSDWGRTLFTSDLQGSNTNATLYPVTFGGSAKNAALPEGGAFNNPEAGIAKINRSEQAASAAKEYFQFVINIKATSKGAQVAKDVYLSDIVLEDINASAAVTEALRMHLDVYDGSAHKYFLISNTAQAGLDCHGALDLDGDGADDTGRNYEWESETTLDYGMYVDADNDASTPDVVDTTAQTTYAISEIKNERNSDGTLTANDTKKLGTTKTSGTLDVTVTVWLEGWELLNSKNVWDLDTLDHTQKIHAGLTFDVGSDAFEA